MTSSSNPEFQTYAIQNTTLPPNQSGTEPDSHQSLILASILDLFAGYPTKRKLSLWTDDASFSDPLTVAEGRKQYEAQWYGLKSVFSDVQRLDASISKVEKTELEIKMKNHYKTKGIGSEQTIDSVVLVKLDSEGKKITKVVDQWGGDVPPEGAFAKAMRNLNSVVVPKMVSVPNSIEEEEAKK